jgi:hypothetical protein
MRNHDRLKRLLRIMALITILAGMFLAVYVTLPDVGYRTLAGRLQPWPFRMGCLMLIVIGPGALVRVSAALPLVLVSYAEYWASAHSGTSGHGSGLPLVTAGGGWFAFILVLVYAPALLARLTPSARRVDGQSRPVAVPGADTA